MSFARDYGQDRELAKQFLTDFSHTDDDGQVVPKYAQLLTKIANREEVHLLIELTDIEKFNQDLADHIQRNTQRYVQIFHLAVDEILPRYKTKELICKDPMDIFIEQRLSNAERMQNNPSNNSAPTLSQPGTGNPASVIINENKYPPDLIRRVEITFKPTTFTTIPVREVLSEHMGHLITIKGIVTRATDVKPRITIQTYVCDLCGFESFQETQGLDYTPLSQCPSSICKNNKTLGKITMRTRGSKFVSLQEIKLQEHSDQVPIGGIPRTMSVISYGALTRLCTPGDHVSISGIYMSVEKPSYRARTGGLAADTYLLAQYITKMNKTEDDELDVEPMEIEEALQLAQGEQNFLGKLCTSIAPEIYGHTELKKALLLLLVGGVDTSPHGMRIRGNINICLMGDPGVAKSQLLSFIDRMAIRSQYTTGRGSSGVGLTAAVLRDPITNEMVLEGGALVLADNGICCIDEFDKMMDADRTAIHEVMEQQTVSIAKAGIMTTLNARVSVLAAANPAYGKYDPNKNVTDNLQLPQALLSRFDLLWLIRDKPQQDSDLNLAKHVMAIHSSVEPPPSYHDAIDMKTMRKYIELCKKKNPVLTKNLAKRLTKIYEDIRSSRRSGLKKDSLFTSPRSLLAIIRLSTAFARLRLSDVVEDADITAAVDLYNSSRDSIEARTRRLDDNQDLIGIIKSLCKAKGTKELRRIDIAEKAASLGFNPDQISEAFDLLEQYECIECSGDVVVLVS